MSNHEMTADSTSGREQMELLVQWEARRLRRYRLWRWIGRIWAALVLWAALQVHYALSPEPLMVYDTNSDAGHLEYSYIHTEVKVPWIGIAVAVAGAWPLLVGLRRASADGRSAKLTISGLDAMAAVGLLTVWLSAPDRIARDLALNRLLDLLPRMRETDAGLLTDADHRRLNDVFATKDSRLALAVLAAWEQVGDGRDVRSVQYVAEGLDIGRRDPVVQRAAMDCMPFLVDRAEKQRYAATLLRAARGGDDDSLLRPAGGRAGDAGQTLLKPASQD